MASVGSVLQEKLEEVSWGQVLLAGAVGALLGGGYSVIDQTILHAENHQIDLPYKSTLLTETMPDIMVKMQNFYQLRRLIKSGPESKKHFKTLAVRALKQTEAVGALYDACMQVKDIDPEMTAISHWTQAKTHVDVIIKILRTMITYIDQSESLRADAVFNELYESFQNRLYLMRQKIE
jgi:flagellin-specific chaperone FliS